MKYNNDSNNDFPIIHTDRTIQANKLDITIKDHKEKTCKLIDFTFAMDIFLLKNFKNCQNIKIFRLR